MGGVIVCLILASFLKSSASGFWKVVYEHRNGLICVALLIVGLVVNIIKSKKFAVIKGVVKEIDYQTLLLLASLFVIVKGIEKAGVIDKLSDGIVALGGNNLFLTYTIIVFASVLISAFVDNIPYVLTMLPVCRSVAFAMGASPLVLYFGLLIGATLGGNITPIGASANITGIGILRKEGYEVKAKEFMKVSVPFTLTAVLSGYLFTWIFWGIL
jgi:Na+/H+ antiporter NhaD/arsenite permease-like protein